MDRSLNFLLSSLALLLCCAAASMKALASPPLAERSPSSHAPVSRPLDLRLPSAIEPAGAPGYALWSGMHRSSGFKSGGDFRSGEDGPAAPSTARPARIPGNVEAFAQRFRHEGLPLARLWENHSALVSLGLNGKGKPGIWLVQKTH